VNPPGYNPLNWKCEERGCFNVLRRPKIEEYAGCFPGRIAMTDIDATVEVNGHFLFLEFKGGRTGDLPTGQRLYFERLTRLHRHITAVIISGDSQTMAINAIRIISKGVVSPSWEECDSDGLKTRLSKWATAAQSRSLRMVA
jgi:hypothetical protein